MFQSRHKQIILIELALFLNKHDVIQGKQEKKAGCLHDVKDEEQCWLNANACNFMKCCAVHTQTMDTEICDGRMLWLKLL